MSINRTIKDDYDRAPLAGGDPTKEIYLQADDGVSDIGMSISQLSAAVQYNMGLVSGDFVLRISIAANTLTWQAEPISGIVYTHHMYTEDDDVEPLLADVRWLNESQDLQGTLSSWGAKTIRLFVRNSTTVTQIPTADGTGVVVVMPIDTNDPQGSLALEPGNDPTTQIDCTITASDAETGVDTDNISLYNVDTNLPLLTTGVGLSVTLSNLLPDKEYNIEAHIPDFAGNVFVTPSRSIKTDAGGTEGTLAFSDSGLPAASHTEPSTPAATNVLTTRVLLNGRTDTYQKGVSVGIWEWTVSNTGQVEALTSWSPVNGLLVFPSGTDYVDLEIDITGVASPENKRFELYLHTPTAVSGSVPGLEENNAILIDLLGQGGVSSGAYNDNTNDRFILDTDIAPQLTAGAAGENYVTATAPVADTDGPTDVYHLATSTGTNLVGNSDYYNLGARLEYDLNIPADGYYYIWVRMLTVTTWNFTAHAGFDGVFDSINHILKNEAELGDWDFTPLALNSAPTIPIAKYLTAGVHKFFIVHREQSTNIYFARVHVAAVPEGTYDPSSNGTGPAIDATDPMSVQDTVASVIDDVNNPQFPVGAIPSTTLQASLFPTNVASDVPQVSTLALYFPEATGLVLNPSQISVKADGGEVTGIWNQDFISQAIFTDANGFPIQFPAGATIAVTGSNIGSVVDPTDQERKAILLGTWSFDIIDTVASPLLIDVDFQDHPIGDYTPTMRDADFDVLVAGGYPIDVSLFEVALDADSNRGNTLKINFPAGVQSVPGFMAELDAANTMIRFPVADERYPDSTDPVWDLTGNPPIVSAFQAREARRTAGTEVALDTAYLQYDIKFSANWRWNRGHKLMGMSSGDALVATHNGPAFGEGIYGQGWRTAYSTHAGYAWIPEGKAAFMYYLYSAGFTQVQWPVWMNLVNGDTFGSHYFSNQADFNPAHVYYPSKDKWIRVWQKVGLGTAIAVPSGGPNGNGMPSITASRIESVYNDSATFVADGNVVNSGTVDMWVQEEDWPAPIKVVTWRETYRWTQYLKIDGLSMVARMNANEEIPFEDQFLMYDNIKVDGSDFGFPS